MKKAPHRVWGGRPHYPQVTVHTWSLSLFAPVFWYESVMIFERWWVIASYISLKRYTTDQVGSHPLQALYPKTLISILLTNHSRLENKNTGQEIQLWGQSQFCGTCLPKLKTWNFGNLFCYQTSSLYLSGILKALILNLCLKYGSVQRRSVSQMALIIVNVLFPPLKKSGYDQKPKYWKKKKKHSNFTIWWSCSTAVLLKTRDTESQLLENSIHRTAGWEQGLWQISHKHITVYWIWFKLNIL